MRLHNDSFARAEMSEPVNLFVIALSRFRPSHVLAWVAAAGLMAALQACGDSGQAANSGGTKNVILMIADGSGASAIAADGMYSGKLGKQIFDGRDWTKAWVSTYPLRSDDRPKPGAEGLAQDPATLYDPAKNWDTTPVKTKTGDFADHFAGYAWTKKSEPDSATTMSAIVNGHKSYLGAVNVDGNGVRLPTFAETANRLGKSVGVVTTVQISDATPAAGSGAHNVSRANGPAITNEMLGAGIVSVIMGTGNPDYDDDGARRNMPDYTWISEVDWTALKSGAHPSGFMLIQDKAEFDALVKAANPPKKLMGIAHSFNSTQFNRSGAIPAMEAPNMVPRKTDVPSLTTMVRGALNILDRNRDGMFLVIEGGAVDRAEHGNNMGRMIEERMEFDDAVATVSAYLDANTNGNNWSNTLLIVTADHDHLLLGPDSDIIPYQELVDKGVGQLPGYRWQNNSHSNQLVPLYARGLGANLFTPCAKRSDAYTDGQGRKFGRGTYLDQTEIVAVMAGVGCH
jgi:alkaline phosphatase